MPIVRLSTDNHAAARQIVAWLAYPDDEKQRERAVHTQYGYLQRLCGQTPRYESGKAVENKTTQSRMRRIDQLFFEALNAGQISTLSIVKDGIEIAPWPVSWGTVARRLATYATGEDDRKQIYKRYWRRFRPVLHLAAAMNGHLASVRYAINMSRPLEHLLLETQWIDPVLSRANDMRLHGDRKLNHFGSGDALIEFFR
ncbi:hypothetical protein [Sphingorhabdus contaminans]|uniref:Transposase n=1 Tax=Sphingorhabdus contaminans TaxID=1343899 RepID=A0A553WIP3_9SPHN|nr:hypothetical protein [Sphingorhabdus contaminans]TSB04577.1 hypothetical protein FOM92_03945 [Sphingorhabdus contaminans]